MTLSPTWRGCTSLSSRNRSEEVELTFTATRETANPYTEAEAWVDFIHDDGAKIRRPIFWDGDRTFRVRFASTKAAGIWHWLAADRSEPRRSILSVALTIARDVRFTDE